MAVPTDDGAVKARLRAFGEPITLFGEGVRDRRVWQISALTLSLQPGERRDRLKQVIQELQEAKGEKIELESESESEEEGEPEEEFYTPGSDDLLHARRRIAEFSLRRARKRIARQKVEASLPLSQVVETRKQFYKDLKVSLFAATCPVLGRRLSRHSHNSALKLEMIDRFRWCDSPRMALCCLRDPGRATRACGTYQTATSSRR